jgi:hypothetical protein
MASVSPLLCGHTRHSGLRELVVTRRGDGRGGGAGAGVADHGGRISVRDHVALHRHGTALVRVLAARRRASRNPDPHRARLAA